MYTLPAFLFAFLASRAVQEFIYMCVCVCVVIYIYIFIYMDIWIQTDR